ncbi:MAG: hypothetical protein CL946_06750 [Ectothiorhodospiraceae bacterium]|nr:hypothetical protein [Ectothiorhodospiraceae bacterium]
MAEVLIPLTFFALIGITLWKHFDGRHKERMAIIESNAIGEDVRHLYGKGDEATRRFTALKWGLVFTFGGLGMALSGFLFAAFPMHEDQVVFGMFGIISGMSGLGLLLYYRLASKHEAKKEEQRSQEA